jgi:endoglycosylceramidase
VCAALAAAIACVFVPAASADPEIPLGHEGRWITDADGRVVILHGVNMVYKRPPYAPDEAGFSDDDAAFLEENGFNTVRLGLIYKAVEPNPGAYDEAYLDRLAATERILGAHGIFSQLDFHQDLYNERYGGEGWPDWATIDDGLPAEPKPKFPETYATSPGMNQAFNSFWLNRAGPGGVGLQDRYAAAFRRVAERFRARDTTMGFDLMNEPWPGTQWPTCANPAGCPVFDTQVLAPFHERVIDQIREVEPQKLIWYEPNVIFNFGADSHHPATGDDGTGFSFHVYCLAGAFALPGMPSEGCETMDELVFENADKQAEETGDALLLSEFGATDDLDVLRRNVEQAETHMISWQYWHYCGCDDPTSQDAANQAVVNDAELPPTGENVREAKRDLLSRAYPQVVAGTPEGYDYDEEAGTFQLAYSTTGPDGESFAPPSPSNRRATEVFIPADDYPTGYDVDVDGGVATSAPGSGTLRVLACPGAERVELTVSPAGQGAGNGPDCALQAEVGSAPEGPAQSSTPPPPRPRPRRAGPPRKRKPCRGRHRSSSPRPKRCASRRPSGSRRSSGSGREAAR